MDRPKNPPNHLMPNSTNMSVSNGNIWKEQRYFSIQALRKLGMAKQEMEEQLQSEIHKLVEEIDKKGDECINLDSFLYSSVSNNILKLLMGRSLDYEDKDRIFLNDLLKTMTMFFRPTRIHAYFPWLKSWMIKWKIWGYDRAECFMDKLGRFIEKQIDNHKRTLDQYTTRDYIDAYLQSLESTKIENSSFSEKMLKGNFQSLFSAGSTPSRATLEWTLLSMILYPHMQKKVQEELDSVIGRERQPTWADHVNLPYTLAVIYEAMRQNSIVPISMLRCTSTRVKLAGFDIPKDTIIMTNIWGVHHDPKSWENSFTFKPERFIQDGKTFRPQEFIAFSYGKRNCFGEDMAMMTVFLYFATLMQRYSISLPDESKEVQQVLGVARLVVLDNVLLKRRK
uniref:Cytochrome P450 2J6 n=1 Tax=Parasteatoda tepidariorum TaxID=114398 RepID=A0A2L2Y6L0_PARTP